jgi:hypothetical protein
MSECPICFEDGPDTTTDCCKQRIHKRCLEQCKKSCPFCRAEHQVRAVIIEIETEHDEVPVTHARHYFRYERFCIILCLVFSVIFITGVCTGMTFAILQNKKILAMRRDYNATTMG